MQQHSVPASDVTSGAVFENAKSNFQFEEVVWEGGPTGTLATAGCCASKVESTGTLWTAAPRAA